MNNELEINNNIKFGCEIEFTRTNNFDSTFITNNNYEYKKDASGFAVYEAISPILSNDIQSWETLKSVLEYIKNNNGYIVGNEGAHIHFDRSILNTGKLKDFLKTWYVFEDIIYQFSNGDYVNSRSSIYMYAKKLGDDLKTNIDIYDDYSMYNKRYGLNLNHKKYNTYEVRVPNGTLNFNTWQNNIEFFSSLFSFANDDNNKIIIDKLYQFGKVENDYEHASLLCDLIFKSDDSKKRFLDQYKHEDRKFLIRVR